MKRTLVVEDWSRFNRAVLEAADGPSQRPDPPRAAPPAPKRVPLERVSEPGNHAVHDAMIAHQNWRKYA